MLRAFNAFQILSMFVGLPFGIGWLHTSPFPFSIAVEVLAVAVYCIMFVCGVVMLSNQMKDW